MFIGLQDYPVITLKTGLEKNRNLMLWGLKAVHNRLGSNSLRRLNFGSFCGYPVAAHSKRKHVRVD